MSIIKCPECGVYKGSAITVCPQCDHDPFSLSRHTPTQPLRPPTLTLPKPAVLAPTAVPKPAALAPTPVPMLVAAFEDTPTPQPASPQQISVVVLAVALGIAVVARPLAAAGLNVSVGAADVLGSAAAAGVLALHSYRALALFGVGVCAVAVAELALVDHATGAMTALQFCVQGCALVLALRPSWRPSARA